jgi:DNA-binding LacI/PurR family transcriptional regulator
VRGRHSIAAARKYVLGTIDYDRGREMGSIRALLSQRVNAILVPSIGHRRETRTLLRNLPVPLIEVGNLPKRPIHFAVGYSDFDAGYLATKRLIEAGRRSIGIICGRVADTSNARDRLAGYRRALVESDAPFVAERTVQVDHAIDRGIEGLFRLLASARKLDGLVIGGEIWASAVMLQLLQSGRSIPDDLAVVGIGEVELGRYLPVPLTFVALPRRDCGVKSAELAMALFRNEPVAEPVVRLPVRLVSSASA